MESLTGWMRTGPSRSVGSQAVRHDNPWIGFAGLCVLALSMAGVHPARAQSPQGRATDPDANAPPSGSSEVQQSQAAPAGEPHAPRDLAKLREAFVELMDEAVRLRSRIAAVSKRVGGARVTIALEHESGDVHPLEGVELFVDGVPVFSEQVGSSDRRTLFEGAMRPGMHQLTLLVTFRDREGQAYRHQQRSQFGFEVAAKKRTEVTAVVEDDSQIAEDFPDDGEGEYEVLTRLRVATRAAE